MRKSSVRVGMILSVLCISIVGCGIEEVLNPPDRVLKYDAIWGVPVGHLEYNAKEMLQELLPESTITKDEVGNLFVQKTWEEEYNFPISDMFQLRDGQQDYAIPIPATQSTGEASNVQVHYLANAQYIGIAGEALDSIIFSAGRMTLAMQLHAPLDLGMVTTLGNFHGTDGPMQLRFARSTASRRNVFRDLSGYTFDLTTIGRREEVALFSLDHSLSIFLGPDDAIGDEAGIGMRLSMERQKIGEVYGVIRPRVLPMRAGSFTFNGVNKYGFRPAGTRIGVSVHNTYGVPMTVRFDGSMLHSSAGNYNLEGDFFTDEHFVQGRSHPHAAATENFSPIITESNANLLQLLNAHPESTIHLPVTFGLAPSLPAPQQAQHFLREQDSILVRMKITQPLYGQVEDMAYNMRFSNDFIDPAIRKSLRPYVDKATFRILVVNGMPLQAGADVEFMNQGKMIYQMERTTLVKSPQIDETGRAMHTAELLSDIVLDGEALDHFLQAEETAFRFYFSSPMKDDARMNVRVLASDIFQVKLALIADTKATLEY